MKTEVRFLLAIVLMLVVLVGTNVLFPPQKPEEGLVADSAAVGQLDSGARSERPGGAQPATLFGDSAAGTAQPVQQREVTVEGPLYRLAFSNVGARLLSAELLEFKSLSGEGLVDLVPQGAGGYLGHKLLVGRDTVDLTDVAFQVEPADGLRLADGDGPKTLTFTYEVPGSAFRVELSYEFRPEQYAVHVHGRVAGVDHALVITDLGQGLAFAEADSAGEARAMAYVANHVQEGIHATPLKRPRVGVQAGPFLWAAFKSKFFVMALLAGQGEGELQESDYLGGLLVSPGSLPERADVAVTQTVHADGTFGHRLFMGPQEYARLSSLGEDMEEVNPYGWRFIRPVVRPLTVVITDILVFLHSQLSVAYGWVLVIFGVLMRVVLWPLNQKAMRAQLKNMAVQPLLQEIQTKYKGNPERLNKEMLRLHKEHGFNPMAGCLPMLLPYPVLIALFFVFQNSIQLRGVAFLWLPDLSAPDPIYVLPVFMAASMFLMQLVTMRSLPQQQNSQMKMMMWLMPIMMLFIFFRLASGLNLYYATANIATIPQQIWIAKERKKVQVKTPAKS
jgi:YidC/Oxa1 family membrane protein insertase